MYISGLLSGFTKKVWYNKYSLKCSVTAHFNGKKLQFGGVVVLFMGCECQAAIRYQIKLAICLFLGKHYSWSLLRIIHFKEEVLCIIQWKPEQDCSCRLVLMPGRSQGHFQKVTATLTFYWLPLAKYPFNGWVIHVKPFIELPIMAYEVKEGSNFGIGLWQCTLSNGF